MTATRSSSSSSSSPPHGRKKRHTEKNKKDQNSGERERPKGRRARTSSSRSAPAWRRARREGGDESFDRLRAGNTGVPGACVARAIEEAGPVRSSGGSGFGDSNGFAISRSRSRDEQHPGRSQVLADGGRGAPQGATQGKGTGKGKIGETSDVAPEPKEEPNFEPSGLLAMEDNSKNGIPLKFTEPPEARRPATKWRLYLFLKQNEGPKVLHIHRMPGYLFGKDRRVVDVPTDHPTCSKQHAVLHHRYIGSVGEVRPYIMDLESTNGTFLNDERIEPARYVELRERDRLKFGMSSREYVLLHAGSASNMAIDHSLLADDSN